MTKTFKEYQSLETFAERKEYYLSLDADEVADSEFTPIELAFEDEQAQRQSLLNDGICPECHSDIIDESYTDDDSHQTISDLSCNC